MKQSVVSMIEDYFFANDLKRGEDFEIVSYIVLDDKFDFYSMEHFFGINSNKIFHLDNLDTNDVNDFFRWHPKMQNVMSLTETLRSECRFRIYNRFFKTNES